MITRAVMGVLGLAICAALVWLFFVTRENASLSLQNASLERSLASLTQQATQAREAAAVARAAAKREAEIADEYEALRSALINGESDEPLPQWFVDYLDRLLGRVR